MKAQHFVLGIIAVFYSYELRALEPTYFKKEIYDFPLREQSIIISENGFFPNKLSVFQGERVRFFITSLLDTQSCFNIPAKNVFSSPLKGEIIEREVVFETSGTYVVNCPNMAFEARLTVIEKNSDKIESQRRGLASDITKVWAPKDTPTSWAQERFEDNSELNLNHKTIEDFPRYRIMNIRNARDVAQERFKREM